MPRINRGAVRALAGYSQSQRERQEEQYKNDREFQQRLYEAGLKGAIEEGRLQFNVESGRFETPTMQASNALDRSLPQGPFVHGPEGGFIASATGEGEVAPNALVPRQQVIQSLAPSLGNALVQQRQQQPVYRQTDTGMDFVGNVPRNSRILPARSKAAFDFSEFDTPTTSVDPVIQQRISELRRGGMPDEQITAYLLEKGIDPSVYGL